MILKDRILLCLKNATCGPDYNVISVSLMIIRKYNNVLIQITSTTYSRGVEKD